MEIIKSLLLFLISLNIFGEICLLKNTNQADFVISNNQILDNFSTSKLARAESEKMLSLLISAKSPMITNWVKARKLDPLNKPNEVALEWDKYYAKNFLINKYPTSNLELNKEIEKTFNLLINKNLTPDKKKYFEKTFEEEKKNALAYIEKSLLKNESKLLIQKRIKLIKLYWPEQFIGSKFEKFPLEFLDWSLAFDPHHNEINIGLNALLYNEENLRSAILHEIAHSFDSCRWNQFENSEWPFSKTGTCLRQFAKMRDDSKLENLHLNKKIFEDEYQFMKKNRSCNNSNYPPIGIQADQLPETFADWFSAEATDVNKITNQFRSDLCEDRTLNPGSSYLTNRERLYKIFIANKKIALKLGIKSEFKNCTLDN